MAQSVQAAGELRALFPITRKYIFFHFLIENELRGVLIDIKSSNESYARLAGYDTEYLPLKKEEATWDHSDYCHECNFKFGVTGRHHCRYSRKEKEKLLFSSPALCD